MKKKSKPTTPARLKLAKPSVSSSMSAMKSSPKSSASAQASTAANLTSSSHASTHKKQPYPPFLIAGVSVVAIALVITASYFSKPLAQDNDQSSRMSGTQTATVVVLPNSNNTQNGTTTGTTGTPQAGQNGQVGTTNNSGDPTMVMQEAGAVSGTGLLKFKIDRFKKLALQPLEFDIFDENNKPLKPEDLKITHEKKLHLIIVSADLKYFLHLHPDFIGGKWKVLANLPNAGTYYAYADIAPVNGDPVVLRSDLVVQNPTPANIAYPDLTPDLKVVRKSSTNQEYSAQLTLTRPTVLQQSVLSFQLTSQGAPIKNLQPYLGALGHVVIFREGDPDSFMHTHPLSSSDSVKAVLEFLTTFSKAGRYVAFAEFKLGVKVYMFPIVFEVKES